MDLKGIYLSIYSFGFSAGFLKSSDGPEHQQMTLSTLMELAHKSGLGGIEIPIDRYFPTMNEADIVEFHRKLASLGLGLTCDLEEFDFGRAQQLARIVPKLGGNMFRVKMSGIYGGARYQDPSFPNMLSTFTRDLVRLAPDLKANGVKVLIENHQDLCAEELLDIIHTVGESCVGVNWDMGSSLALGETPLSFLEKVAPHVGNVHLKDYLLFSNSEGFKLVRCPLGKGVVDFTSCMSLLYRHVGKVPMSIELGAWVARQADIFLPEYWRAFPPGERSQFFDFIANHSVKESDGNWKTAWEKSAPGREVSALEFKDLEQTVAFLATVPMETNA